MSNPETNTATIAGQKKIEPPIWPVNISYEKLQQKYLHNLDKLNRDLLTMLKFYCETKLTELLEIIFPDINAAYPQKSTFDKIILIYQELDKREKSLIIDNKLSDFKAEMFAQINALRQVFSWLNHWDAYLPEPIIFRAISEIFNQRSIYEFDEKEIRKFCVEHKDKPECKHFENGIYTELRKQSVLENIILQGKPSANPNLPILATTATTVKETYGTIEGYFKFAVPSLHYNELTTRVDPDQRDNKIKNIIRQPKTGREEHGLELAEITLKTIPGAQSGIDITSASHIKSELVQANWEVCELSGDNPELRTLILECILDVAENTGVSVRKMVQVTPEEDALISQIESASQKYHAVEAQYKLLAAKVASKLNEFRKLVVEKKYDDYAKQSEEFSKWLAGECSQEQVGAKLAMVLRQPSLHETEIKFDYDYKAKEHYKTPEKSFTIFGKTEPEKIFKDRRIEAGGNQYVYTAPFNPHMDKFDYLYEDYEKTIRKLNDVVLENVGTSNENVVTEATNGQSNKDKHEMIEV
jgi:hypothetical protein